jgi:general secretion pathway protein G
MQAKRGFTLVEILIVVVILGILAAIVIPQFTQASTEAKTSSLSSDLQTLRSQIELYKVQHNDTAPLLATFTNQMMYCTDIAGTASTSKARDATHQYGPYLETVPANPFNNFATLGASTVATPLTDNSVGWGYDALTGEIHAADTVDHAKL